MTSNHSQMSSNDVDYFCGNRFLAHFWAILEPRYGHLKAFLGPKMTKTRSKQPKTTPNHPKNGQKWCRNIFEKIDFGVILGSFWGHFGVILGHFGSFWVILGHFEPKKWANIAYKILTWPQTLENRKSWNPSVNSATVIFGAKMAVKD